MAASWVLISGASTGIGRATALALAARGFKVLAGVRSESAAQALEATGGGLVPVMLDVTSEESIRAAIARTAELSGADGLSGLINNAGIVVPGPVEFVSSADWRLQFDVNFFGAIELTRAALPLLRKNAAAHGFGTPRLLLVSSIGGRVAQPFLSPYTSSKFALTALGDSLRLELRRQGIGVTVIEPGAIATDIWGKGDVSAEHFTGDNPAIKLYGPELEGLKAAASRIASGAISADRAAAEIVRAFTAKRAPARVLVGRDAKIMARLRALLPISVFDGMLAKEFGLPPARG
jgi:NAD(P)-dependent dehydrogenase (short-subunit alcohol dehydrogenase family)